MSQIRVFENNNQFAVIANYLQALASAGEKVDEVTAGLILICSANQDYQSGQDKDVIVQKILQNVLKLLIDNGSKLQVLEERENKILLRAKHLGVGFTLKLRRNLANFDYFLEVGPDDYCKILSKQDKSVVLIGSLSIAESEHLRFWIVGEGILVAEMICPSKHWGYHINVDLGEIFFCDSNNHDPFHERTKCRVLSRQATTFKRTIWRKASRIQRGYGSFTDKLLLHLPVVVTHLPDYNNEEALRILEDWRVVDIVYFCRVTIIKVPRLCYFGKVKLEQMEYTASFFIRNNVTLNKKQYVEDVPEGTGSEGAGSTTKSEKENKRKPRRKLCHNCQI